MVLDRLRVHLEKEPLADAAERRAFAQAVLALFPKWVERWRQGEPHGRQTSIGSKKLKERIHLLDRAAHPPPTEE